MENRISSFPDGGISQKWKIGYQVFLMEEFSKMENRISNFPDGGVLKNGKSDIKFS